jgi:hypothetical protein
MSASDSLNRVQFRQDPADRDHPDKAGAYDAAGADADASYGYSAEDMADYQYERYGRTETSTNPKHEVF